MSQINVGFDNYSPQAVDRSYGALSAGANVPYASVAAAIAAVTFRYIGKTVLIATASGNVEYWWRSGIGDGLLVPKINGEQRIDFVIGDGQGFTPADKATVLTIPAMINSAILGFGGDAGEISPIARTGFQSFTYSAPNGTISLVNTKFAQNSWYYVKFRQL